MKTILTWGGGLLCIWLYGCAVMPGHVQNKALPTLSYIELTRNIDKYAGETVILGGYVLSVENLKDHSRLNLLQTPLGLGQRPKGKDLSQGRVTLFYEGFLDAEVYAKDRKVTFGGRILQPVADGSPSYPHMRIAASYIHLWPEEIENYDGYRYNRWYPYPWWRGHSYRHHHRHHRYWRHR